jgi:hypothetical protein
LNDDRELAGQRIPELIGPLSHAGAKTIVDDTGELVRRPRARSPGTAP